MSYAIKHYFLFIYVFTQQIVTVYNAMSVMLSVEETTVSQDSLYSERDGSAVRTQT